MSYHHVMVNGRAMENSRSLQSTAEHCRALQNTALQITPETFQIIPERFRTFQIPPEHCKALPKNAEHCRSLQIIPVHSRALQSTPDHSSLTRTDHSTTLQSTAEHSKTFQIIPEHCRALPENTEAPNKPSKSLRNRCVSSRLLDMWPRRLVVGHISSQHTIEISDKQKVTALSFWTSHPKDWYWATTAPNRPSISVTNKLHSPKAWTCVPEHWKVGHNSSKHTIENCKKQMCQPKASEHIIQKIGSGTQLLHTNHRNLWQTSLPVQSTWTCVPEHWWWSITAPNRPSISDKQTWQLKASKHIIQKTGSGSMKALNQK